MTTYLGAPPLSESSMQRLAVEVAQTNAFVAGDVVRHNGTEYVKALAATPAEAEWVGVVETATSSGFTLIISGSINLGLAYGTWFLSDVTAGLLSLTEPGTPNVSAPVLISTGTDNFVFRLRPVQPGILQDDQTLNSLFVSNQVGFGTQGFSASGTLGAAPLVLVDASSGEITLDLPILAGCVGRVYNFGKSELGGNRIVLNPDGAELIGGKSEWKTRGPLTVVGEASGWRVLSSPKGPIVGVSKGVDFNSTGDALLKVETCNKWVFKGLLVTNASTSLTTAVGGAYTGAGKTGITLVAAAQAYSSLAAANLTLTASAAAGIPMLTADAVYFSLTTAQGSAATADIYVLGDILE